MYFRCWIYKNNMTRIGVFPMSKCETWSYCMCKFALLNCALRFVIRANSSANFIPKISYCFLLRYVNHAHKLEDNFLLLSTKNSISVFRSSLPLPRCSCYTLSSLTSQWSAWFHFLVLADQGDEVLSAMVIGCIGSKSWLDRRHQPCKARQRITCQLSCRR